MSEKTVLLSLKKFVEDAVSKTRCGILTSERSCSIKYAD